MKAFAPGFIDIVRKIASIIIVVGYLLLLLIVVVLYLPTLGWVWHYVGKRLYHANPPDWFTE